VASVIDYSPTVIGERSYICPVRSLTTTVERASACPSRYHNPAMAHPTLMINEGSFTDYHRLGSTARILNNGVDTPGEK
jgi:hypothetical protein